MKLQEASPLLFHDMVQETKYPNIVNAHKAPDFSSPISSFGFFLLPHSRTFLSVASPLVWHPCYVHKQIHTLYAFLCVHVCMCLCVYMSVCVYMSEYVSLSLPSAMGKCKVQGMCTCMCVCLCVCVCLQAVEWCNPSTSCYI